MKRRNLTRDYESRPEDIRGNQPSNPDRNKRGFKAIELTYASSYRISSFAQAL
jgi:hypothetical protein